MVLAGLLNETKARLREMSNLNESRLRRVFEKRTALESEAV